MRESLPVLLKQFQSTFPRGERREGTAIITAKCDFNPRSRVGNDGIASEQYTSFPNFNPRSRVGNDGGYRTVSVKSAISIHVPAWGTTGSDHGPCTPTAISIHVPAWGTTNHHQTQEPTALYFNPRSRVGNDVSVSTSTGYPQKFQSTFPRGERQEVADMADKPIDFNPRSRVGNDCTRPDLLWCCVNFNPRSRVGNDG